jgi:hypothetical protein
MRSPNSGSPSRRRADVSSPLPVAAWHATVGPDAVHDIAKGDEVLAHGQLVRRFYRSESQSA